MKKYKVTSVTSVQEIFEQQTKGLISAAEKRKMFRFGEKAHKLAKIVAALDGKTIQDYIDELVVKDVKKRFPKIYKDNFPNE